MRVYVEELVCKQIQCEWKVVLFMVIICLLVYHLYCSAEEDEKMKDMFSWPFVGDRGLRNLQYKKKKTINKINI